MAAHTNFQGCFPLQQGAKGAKLVPGMPGIVPFRMNYTGPGNLCSIRSSSESKPHVLLYQPYLHQLQGCEKKKKNPQMGENPPECCITHKDLTQTLPLGAAGGGTADIPPPSLRLHVKDALGMLKGEQRAKNCSFSTLVIRAGLTSCQSLSRAQPGSSSSV